MNRIGTQYRTRRNGASSITILEIVLGVTCVGIVGAIAFSTLRGEFQTLPVPPEEAMLKGTQATTLSTAAHGAPKRAANSAGSTSLEEEQDAAVIDTTPQPDDDTAQAELLAEGDIYLSAGDGGERPSALNNTKHSAKAVVEPEREQAERLAALHRAISSGTMNQKQIKAAMQDIAPEDVEAALAAIADMEWGPNADALFQGLMSRWGQLEPVSALEYAASIDSRLTRNAAVKNALLSWASADPDAAFAWLSSDPDVPGDAIKSSLRPFFSMMAKKDPGWAFDHIWDLPNPQLQRSAVYSVIGRMSKKSDPVAMSALFNQVSDGNHRQLLAEAMISTWTPYQPELAAEWTEALRGSEAYKPAVDRLISSWGQNAPEAAGDWIMALDEPKLRRSELNRLTAAWIKADPAATSEWLGQYPPSWETDPAAGTLVRATMKADPANAMTWAASITTTRMRKQTMYQVATHWMRQDPASATAYILASDMPQHHKQSLLR
jgi:hypothetical protein